MDNTQWAFVVARSRAAQAVLAYCDCRCELHAAELTDATRRLEIAALLARTPSQQDRATELVGRTAA